MKKVAYLGPEGSYSELAALKLCREAELLPCSNFYRVIGALTEGECENAVVPVENSLNGAVLQVLDLLQASEDLIAVRELSLALDHRIATLSGADIGGISHIYSHEQSLAQCSGYLKKHFPNARLINAPSTAASLEMIKSPTDAAIVGAHIEREGITLSPRNIADSNNNCTHFLLIEKGYADKNKHSGKIFFSVTCRHVSGALLDILEPMREGGMNMTKIQSRPIRDRVGEYVFFIEVEGDYSSKKVREVLENVKQISLAFKLLGTY